MKTMLTQNFGGKQRIKDDVQVNNFMSLRAYEARRKFVEHERGVTVALVVCYTAVFSVVTQRSSP